MTDPRNSDSRNSGEERNPWRAPRSEPEIIPPDRSSGDPRADRIWVRFDKDDEEARRVFMSRPGPLTIVLALAILGLIAALMLVVLLSVALIWIPVVIALIVTFVVTMYARRSWSRFRNWLARR